MTSTIQKKKSLPPAQRYASDVEGLLFNISKGNTILFHKIDIDSCEYDKGYDSKIRTRFSRVMCAAEIMIDLCLEKTDIDLSPHHKLERLIFSNYLYRELVYNRVPEMIMATISDLKINILKVIHALSVDISDEIYNKNKRYIRPVVGSLSRQDLVSELSRCAQKIDAFIMKYHTP